MSLWKDIVSYWHPDENKKVLWECSQCKVLREVDISTIYHYAKRQGSSLTPINLCRRCEENRRRGANNSNWKQGKRMVSGYVYTHIESLPKEDAWLKPLFDKRGYAAAHRIIMSKHLKRLVLPTEDVHHIDGNRMNNGISNLECVNQQTHTLITRLTNELNAKNQENRALVENNQRLLEDNYTLGKAFQKAYAEVIALKLQTLTSFTKDFVSGETIDDS